MNLENIIDTNMGLKSIGKKLLITAIGLGTFFNSTPQIPNKNINSATQFVQNIGIKTAYAKEKKSLEEQGYHPLYDILLNNAKEEKLKEAIIDLAHENYRSAAYILLPDYNPYSRSMGITTTKMYRNKVGRNNPTYWVALKLAAEGVGEPMLYNGVFPDLRNKGDVPLPTDRKIFEFAESIKPGRKTWVLTNWDENVKKKNLYIFQKKILNSNLFKD